MSDFGESTNPVARKDHTCSWCDRPIKKGDRHYHFKGRWQGEWQNWRMHDDCFQCCYDSDSYDYGWMPGDGRNCSKCCKSHP